MSRQAINAICASLPGAQVSDPWGGGHDAWKVGGKMFACIGAITPGVSVKTESIEMAEMLIGMGVGVKAPYFHRSWINIPFDAAPDELRHRLHTSYRIVRASLPKKRKPTCRLWTCESGVNPPDPYLPNSFWTMPRTPVNCRPASRTASARHTPS